MIYGCTRGFAPHCKVVRVSGPMWLIKRQRNCHIRQEDVQLAMLAFSLTLLWSLWALQTEAGGAVKKQPHACSFWRISAFAMKTNIITRAHAYLDHDYYVHMQVMQLHPVTKATIFSSTKYLIIKYAEVYFVKVSFKTNLYQYIMFPNYSL
jgi:hypothetical protein